MRVNNKQLVDNAKATNKTNKNNKKLVRITSKTIEHHRREILNSAKRFKYPLQYEKHRLVLNALLVGVIFIGLFFVMILWRLYKADDTSLLMYKISQILPFQIGQVEHEPVLFSDYLAYYRSSWHYHQTKDQNRTDQQTEEKIQADYKKQAFDNAVKIAYVRSLARQHHLTVTDKEINQELQRKLTYDDTKISLKSFNAIVSEYYGLSQREYRRLFLEYPLLLKKVSIHIDQRARELNKQITDTIQQSNAQLELASLQSKFVERGVEFIDSGLIKYKTNDSGRSEVASKLALKQISPAFVSQNLDSYNIVQLIFKNEDSLRYQALRIPLNELTTQLKSKTDQNKIKKFIVIKEK